jgi:hypothetical protein
MVIDQSCESNQPSSIPGDYHSARTYVFLQGIYGLSDVIYVYRIKPFFMLPEKGGCGANGKIYWRFEDADCSSK